MAEVNIIGRIDCPACGTKEGVRITKDKNGQPFGFCDANCDFQMRLGGKPRRVDAFLSRYPQFKAAFGVEVAPVTVTEPKAKQSSGANWLDNL